MKIEVMFNGRVSQLNGWKPKATVELPDGATGLDLCAHFDVVPGKNRLYGFMVRDGKKMKEEEELHDGDLIKINGKAAGG